MRTASDSIVFAEKLTAAIKPFIPPWARIEGFQTTAYASLYALLVDTENEGQSWLIAVKDHEQSREGMRKPDKKIIVNDFNPEGASFMFARRRVIEYLNTFEGSPTENGEKTRATRCGGRLVRFGAKGARVMPGTPKGDAYCARSLGQMRDHPRAASDPCSPLRLSRKRWACKGGVSIKQNPGSLDSLVAGFSGCGADIRADSRDGLIIVHHIKIPAEQRGRGLGSEIMRALTAFADERGAVLALSPSTDFGGSSLARLRDFYRRFGFVDNKGRNKDYTISETMIRTPAKTNPRSKRVRIELPSNDNMKTNAHDIADALGAEWTRRGGYTLASEKRKAEFELLLAAGFDASRRYFHYQKRKDIRFTHDAAPGRSFTLSEAIAFAEQFKPIT